MAEQRLSRLQRYILAWLLAEAQRTRGTMAASHQDLVWALCHDKGNLSTSLKGLEAKGLVTIARTPGGKAEAVDLTVTGRNRRRPAGAPPHVRARFYGGGHGDIRVPYAATRTPHHRHGLRQRPGAAWCRASKAWHRRHHLPRFRTTLNSSGVRTTRPFGMSISTHPRDIPCGVPGRRRSVALVAMRYP
jgi:hypothetical protein